MIAHDVFDIAHVLHASADTLTGAITAHVGDVHSGEGYDDAAVVFQSWGWLSLPSVPDAGVKAAECVVLKTTSADIVIGGRDVRTAEIAALIKSGESCAYASGSQANTLYKLDGSIINFTTHDNTKAGRSIYSRTSPEGFQVETPWSRFRVDSSGFHSYHASGARIDIGSVSGAPAPFSSLGSYLSMSAGMTRIESAIISLGTDVGVSEPVAKATTLYALLTSISASLSACNAALTAANAALALVPAGTVAGGGAAALATAITLASTSASAANSAVTTATAAIAAAALTLPSTSTSTT